MQNNFNFMFVENFIVNLCILLFVCKVRRLNVCVCVCVCVCAITRECTVLYKGIREVLFSMKFKCDKMCQVYVSIRTVCCDVKVAYV
jgi:hypothetical protein